MFGVVLTHDLDFWRVRDFPRFGRGHMSFLKRCLIDNSNRIGRDLSLGEFSRGALTALGTIARIGPDPWVRSFLRMVEIERQWNVRSTIFVIPFKGCSGRNPDGSPAPKGRASLYNPVDLLPLLLDLQGQGWEVGVHGLSGHVSASEARRERQALESLGLHVYGWRSHWLFTSPALYSNLVEAGYQYDSSSREGSAGCPAAYSLGNRLGVLPITIQDKDILENCRPDDAWTEIRKRLDSAVNRGAVATVLMHTNHFGPPRFWESIFERILEYAAEHDARVGSAQEWVNNLSRDAQLVTTQC